MQWVEIDAAEARQDPIPGEDEYLQIMVSQMQEKLAKMKPRGSTAAAQPPARKTGSTLAACAESPRQLASRRPTHTPRIPSDELCVGKFRKAWKPAPSQPQHGLKSKQRAPNTSHDWCEGAAQAKQAQAEQCTSRTEVEAAYLPGRGFPVTVKPAQTESENRALKATQAAPPPPPTEPEAMHASSCSDDEQETRSDVSGYTSVSKTVVATSNDIEARLSRLETKFEEQNKMILEQTKLTVEQIIPQQLKLSVQAAIQDLKQGVVRILTASVLQTVQNWLTPPIGRNQN
ncbi:hypothetical protein MTO96_052132 [Rhipicephalus appendiculatus]